MKCQDCAYYAIFKIVKNRKPLQYNGDIPCLRCAEFEKEHSEFIPASKLVDDEKWRSINIDF
jgi:hypothetical protein